MSICVCPKCNHVMSKNNDAEIVLAHISKFKGVPESKWDQRFLKFSEHGISEETGLSVAGTNRTVRFLKGAGFIYCYGRIRVGKTKKASAIYALTPLGQEYIKEHLS